MPHVTITIEVDTQDSEFSFCPSEPDKCRGCETHVSALRDELCSHLEYLGLDVIRIEIKD